MKKIFVLIVLLMFVFSGTVLANGRWQWISSTDENGVYFDKQTIRLDNNNDIDVWIKWKNAYPDEKNITETIQNLKIKIRGREFVFISSTNYDESGNVINSENFSPPIIAKVLPDSMGENIFIAVTNYVKRR